jgi:molecular chaperone GrpE
MSSPEETNAGPVIRDLRRIDPATGQVRDPGRTAPAQQGGAPKGATGPATAKPRPGKHAASKPGGTPGLEGTAASTGAGAPPGPVRRPAPADRAETAAADLVPADQLAERTADLQRVTAEYANYRKRVERDRVAVREQALANVLSGLLPVLDDIGRAREHGELVGGFKSVAESLEAAVAKLGLDSFGEQGEPFDPKVHEALMHSYSPDVTEPTCVQILQPGYRVGDRVLRPARVAVAEPSEPALAGEPGQESPAEHD